MQQLILAFLSSHFDSNLELVVKGMRSYVRQHELPWDVRLYGPTNHAEIPSTARLVALNRMLLTEDFDHIQRPVCILSGNDRDPSVRPCVSFDEASFGRLAALHLHECGYQHVAYEEARHHSRHVARIQGFIQECERLKLPVHGLTANHQHDKTQQSRLQHIPKPIGVFAPTDSRAKYLRANLVDAGFRVPDDFGIIAVGNHPRVCLEMQPELTSIAFPWLAMGKAAALMVQRLHSGDLQPDPEIVRSNHIVQRASTRSLTSTDPVVQKAMQWLGKHLDHRQPLQGVLAHVGMSRPTLADKFRRAFNTTPKHMHERLRLQRARTLLANTQFRIEEIAKLSGYSGSTAFGVAFKRYHGTTANSWRETSQH